MLRNNFLERISHFRYGKINIFVVKTLFRKQFITFLLNYKVVINLVCMEKTATFHVPSTVKTAFVTIKTDHVLAVSPDGRDKPAVKVHVR